MPTTNRPFFTNFLAAFRAHSALQKSASASSTVPGTSAATGLSSQSTHISSSASATASAASATSRAIATKSPVGLTSAAVQAAFSPTNTSHAHHARHPSTSPVSRSPALPLTAGAGFNSRNRRGSDTSSDGGFRDALGGEKWFIGGRTAQGDERFYRLGMVTRERSNDRVSLDRMSL